MRLLRRNLVLAYGAYAASIVSGLVTVPIIVRALGKEGYGVWAFIGSIVVFFNLLDFGIGPSVVRFAAAYRGRGTAGETSALASAALVLYGAVTLLSLPLALGAAWLVPPALGVEGDLVWPARIATLLVVGTVIARFPLSLAGHLLVAQQRWDVVNGANIVSALAYLGLVAGLLLDHPSLILLGGIALGTTVVRFALPLPWLRRELPSLRVRRSLVTRARVRELLGFSWHNFLIHVAGKVVFSTDVVVVGVLLGPVAAALYGIPARLFALVFGAGAAATDLLYPALAELEGRDEQERQRGLVLSGLRLGTALMAVLALPMIVMPDLLIEAWIGRGFEESTAVAALLGIALLLHLPAHVLSQYLVARARQRELALVSVAVVAANLALSIALALTVGIWGVALATVVTEAVFVLVLVPRLVAAAEGPSPAQLARALLRPLAAAAVPGAVVLGALGRGVAPDTLAGLAPVGALWVVAGLVAMWLFGLDADDRRVVAARIVPAGA
jgi:O-antigen/teichoic acid export membrane protein